MKQITGASIILTEACNLTCEYCYEHRKSPAVMDETTVKQAVDFLFENCSGEKKLNITWFGGEPLLNFPVLKAGYLYAKEKATREDKVVDHLLVTNGTIIHDEIVDFLYDNPRIRIQVSWDGLHQDVTRGQSDCVVSTIKRLLTLPNQLTIHTQLTSHMVANFEESVDFMAAALGDRFRLAIRPIAEDKGWLDPEVCAKLRGVLFTVFAKYEDKIEKLSNCEFQLESPGTCGAGKNYASITPSGDLYACHRFYFQRNRHFKVGDLDKGFYDTPRTQILEQYTRDNVIGCQGCDAYELCDRCIACNFGENMDILMPPESGCEVSKAMFFSLFNYTKKHRPWLVAHQPKPSLSIADTPNVKATILHDVMPRISQLEGDLDAALWKVHQLEAKVEYYHRLQKN